VNKPPPASSVSSSGSFALRQAQTGAVTLRHRKIQVLGSIAEELEGQPRLLTRILDDYVSANHKQVTLPFELDLRGIDRIVMVAGGTAFHACQIAKYWFEEFASMKIDIEMASEFCHRRPLLDNRDLLIAVSQSAEPADTHAALVLGCGQVSTSLAVVNAPASRIARQAHHVLPTLADPSAGSSSANHLDAQLLCLLLLALRIGQQRGTLGNAELGKLLAALFALPGQVSKVLHDDTQFAAPAAFLAQSAHSVFIGRGCMHPVALVAALSLIKTASASAQGCAEGEFEQGLQGLIDGSRPLVVLAPDKALSEDTQAIMGELHAKGGRVMVMTDAQHSERLKTSYDVMVMPEVADVLTPLVYAVACQRLAHHAAAARGLNGDQPQRIAQSRAAG